MGLNIVATRRYDLSDFAEGWDGAYVIVKVPNAQVRQEYVDFMARVQIDMNTEIEDLPVSKSAAAISAKYDDIADKKVAEMALQLIVRGEVVSTDDETGKSELTKFDKEDVAVVVDALGFAWLTEIVRLALGNDRLKAKN